MPFQSSTAQAQRVAAIDAFDHAYFKAHSEVATYRRRYRPGEWPGPDCDESGAPFTDVIVSRIGTALHRWFTVTGKPGFRHGFTSAPDDRSLEAAKNLVTQFAVSQGLQLQEVAT